MKFLLIAAVLLAVLIFAAMQPDVTPAGGKWVIVTPQSLMIEAGARYNILCRRQWPRRRKIREMVYDTADLGDDCLYYASTLHQVQHFCACGSRRPLLIATDTIHPFERDGVRRLVRQERVGRDDLATGRLETIDLKAVKERAKAQPVVLGEYPSPADAGIASVMVNEPMPKLR